MLKTPEHGWSEITIGDWTDRCSYLDDVPYRLLEAVDDVNRTHMPSSVRLDAEGWEYIIVFDRYSTHIITLDFYGQWKYTTVDIYIKDLIKELIGDIRKDLDLWAEWGFELSDYVIEERKLDLEAWCKVIEKRL